MRKSHSDDQQILDFKNTKANDGSVLVKTGSELMQLFEKERSSCKYIMSSVLRHIRFVKNAVIVSIHVGMYHHTELATCVLEC